MRIWSLLGKIGRLAAVKKPQPHPLFQAVRGKVAQWEKGGLRGGLR